MNDVIDEAQEIVCEELEAIKRTAFVPLRPGPVYFFTQGIAPNVMAPYRLFTPHNNRRLTATMISELDRRNELWIRVTGAPEVWAPVGWDTFVLYPHPAEGGNVLEVNYLAWPDALLDDADEPEIPESTHNTLLLYGVYDGLMKQWDSQRGAQMFQLFLQQFGKDRGRNMGITQARTWQIAAEPGNNFRNSGNPWNQ